MDSKILVLQVKRDFNITIALICIIPVLVFIYLITSKMVSFHFLYAETKVTLSCVLVLFILGVVVGRTTLWTLIRRLISFNNQIVELQDELIEKSSLAAITETALALRHEINNPLMANLAILELLEDELKENVSANKLKERVDLIKVYCERIRQATVKLAALSKPVSSRVYDDEKMVDLNESI